MSGLQSTEIKLNKDLLPFGPFFDDFSMFNFKKRLFQLLAQDKFQITKNAIFEKTSSSLLWIQNKEVYSFILFFDS